MKTKLNGILTLLLALVVQVAFAQQTVTGKVTDPSGEPILGATVVVRGSSNATTTDFDGNYSITASETESLVFSFSGYEPNTILVGNKTIINTTLSTSLDAVVVVAFGTQEKKTNIQSIQTVTSKDIRDIPANSPQELLQGQAAGVQVVQSSGILGAAPVVNIRGTSSISQGSRPLFVVDGVPLSDNVLTAGQGGQPLNPLANINPNDIESLSVLKDAAATAVYGSRGSNGVVLITTKSGRKNSKTRVSVNTWTSFSEATDLFDMMSADEFRQFIVDTGGAQAVTDLPQGEFDWVDGVTTTGVSDNVDISVSGGSEKTSFFISANFKNEDGFIIGNSQDRRAARLNIQHAAKDWLDVGANVSFSFTDTDRVGSENSTLAPLTAAYLLLPWQEPRDEDGAFTTLGFIPNIIANEAVNINRSAQSRINGSVNATAKLFDGLNFSTRFGVDRIVVTEQARAFEIITPGGTGAAGSRHDDRWIWTNTLNYNKTFNDIHDLGVTLGSSYEENDIRTITVAGSGFVSDALINVVSAATPTVTTSAASASRLAGFFARANYAYDQKYIIEGSIRRDGSSRFGAGNRFGTFYAGALGWNIAEEAFLENSSWINDLKLRGSFGVTGNDRIGNFNALAIFNAGQDFNGVPGVAPNNPGNPNLRWERSANLDIALSGALFNNRVRFGLEFYRQNTTDLILNVPLSVASTPGDNTQPDNVGEVENRGVDVSLSADIIRNNNFRWTASINAGFNENEVISLPGATVDSEGREFIASSASQRAIVGESSNSFFLIRYIGVNSETGDAEWLDADGNVTTDPTPDDRVIVGQGNPDVVGGITNNFQYKNFDLNIISNFSLGNSIFVDGLRFTDNAALNAFNNRRIVGNIWQQPGDNAFTPSINSPTFSTFDQRSTLQLRDGDFLRLKNVTLGYTFDEAFFSKIGFFDSIRVYATATNLVTFKGDDLQGIDPEVTNSVGAIGQGETFFSPPQSKSYLFGITFNF